MAKSAAQRINEALTTIKNYVVIDEENEINALLTPANRVQWGGNISLGGVRVIKFSAESEKRKLIRATLLAGLAQGKITLATLTLAKADLNKCDVPTLKRRLNNNFTYKPYAGSVAKRGLWHQSNFTDPRFHNDKSYQYIIHGIAGSPQQVAELYTANPSKQDRDAYTKQKMNYFPYAKENTKNPIKHNIMVRFYEKYLNDPTILHQNIISSSLLNQNKHACYFPFGFILDVPPECIYITHKEDVAVKNRTPDILSELANTKGGTEIKSPADILANTSGTNSDIGYNEIVLVGTSPEGKQVSVKGIYVKTDAKGNIFMRNSANSVDKNGPYVNAEIQKLIQLSADKHGFPIVPIVDTSSGVSTTPWPFVDSTSRMRSTSFTSTQKPASRPRATSL